MITLAHYRPLRGLVVGFLQPRKIIHVSSVAQELKRLSEDHPNNIYFNAAVRDQAWLGAPQEHLHLVDEIFDIRDDLAVGTSFSHPLEHLGESHIIAAGVHVAGDVFVVADDHNARVLAKERGLHPMSIIRLMHEMVLLGLLTPEKAAEHANELKRLGRAVKKYEAANFLDGKLGRIGEPDIIY